MMSLNQSYQYEQQNSFFDLSAGSINDFDFFNIHSGRQQEIEFDGDKPPRKRRDDTNDVVNKLYQQTLMRRPGERDVYRAGGRKNKNEILGLTNARLIKEKHLNGVKYSRDIELVRGIQTNINSGEFVLVLRTDGRIVAMSDEVEQHLGKTMRSLYTQCINMFECLNKTDGNKLRKILESSDDLTNKEHRLVCNFRLPKGKRPSRTREDIKAITMAGHFYTCHDSCYDRLFIARCEALVSCTTNGTSSSQTAIVNNTMIKLILNDDMTVSMVSSNVKDILGYTRNEIIGNWFGRFLATDDLEKFETTRQKYFQNEQQTPINVCDVFDMYTNNGENRLTFLCQIRPTRERRSKLIKYSIIAQLIDPSMRDEYIEYVHTKTEPNQITVKVEQVNLVSPKTSEETIMAHSPSLAMGLLMFDNVNSNEFVHQQQSSPFIRSLSNVVAPFIFDDESTKLFEYEYDQRSTNINMQYWPTKPINDTYIKYQLEQELASIDELFNDF
jgi:PAS domain-containing protein